MPIADAHQRSLADIVGTGSGLGPDGLGPEGLGATVPSCWIIEFALQITAIPGMELPPEGVVSPSTGS
jgi:hypothetical protein